MFTHVTVGSDDLDHSRRFYDALFDVLGADPGTIDAKGRLVYAHAGCRFIVLHPIDGRPAAAGNGHTVSFAMESPEQAEAWHAAGLSHGGTAIEDPPGIRHATEGRTLFLAYLCDPDGNKLCGFHKISG